MAVAARYAAVLKPFAKGLLQLREVSPGYVMLETKAPTFRLVIKGKAELRKAPFMVAAVRAGKAYVSIHVIAAYFNPKLVDRVAPELRKRMQGKACFNFQEYDPAAARKIRELIAAGLAEMKTDPMFAEIFGVRGASKPAARS